MPSNPRGPLADAQGLACRVDSVLREVTVLVGGERVVFDVPPECRVTLRGEPVKLRLVQPGDRLQIAYIVRRGRLSAFSIEAQASGVRTQSARTARNLRAR
jgi:hypothetical protein